MAFNIFMLLLSLTFFACCESYLEQRRLDDLSSYCTKPGLQCADCETSILCRMDDGNYGATLYEECETGYTCYGGVCTDSPNVNCTKPGGLFKCIGTERKYPDPMCCKIFHFCLKEKTASRPATIPNSNYIATPSTKLVLITGYCPDNYAYNALSTYCDKKLPVNGTCPPASIPKCVKNGQMGVLKENPTIYYICRPVTNSKAKMLYPYLNACVHGKQFDEATYACK